MAFALGVWARHPHVPRSREGSSRRGYRIPLVRTDHLLAAQKATLSWRFDSQVSPSAGHPLRGRLAATPTGLPPASPTQLSGHTPPTNLRARPLRYQGFRDAESAARSRRSGVILFGFSVCAMQPCRDPRWVRATGPAYPPGECSPGAMNPCPDHVLPQLFWVRVRATHSRRFFWCAFHPCMTRGNRWLMVAHLRMLSFHQGCLARAVGPSRPRL